MTSPTTSRFPIKPRQQQYLDAIRSVHNSVGRASLRVIGAQMGVASTSTVHHAMQRLVDDGYVRKVQWGKQSYYEPIEAVKEVSTRNLLAELQRLDEASALPPALEEFGALWGVWR